MEFEFGTFTLDLARRELRKLGEPVALQPRLFGVLRYLIEHRDRAVAKQEFIDALWGGQQLNDVAVPWAINRIRKVLGEDDDNVFIETVRGHGYRFVAKLHDQDSTLPAAHRVSEDANVRVGGPIHSEPPFVGRAEVIAELTAALATAGSGRGKMYLLTGEAGIGKTRCADELALIARRAGVPVWFARCPEQCGAPAFWPFIQLLRSAHSELGTERAQLDELLAELEPNAQDEHVQSTMQSVGNGSARFWVLDRLTTLLARSARSQARVAVIDDVHCMDDSSLNALVMLAPLLARSSLLVLLTARVDITTRGHSLSELKARLRPCEQLRLQGLSRTHVAAWLEAVLGRSYSSELAQLLWQRTGGNPLYLQELARMALTHLQRHDSIATWSIELPVAVRDAVKQRLKTLGPETLALLDIASVIGETFDVSVLQTVSGLDMRTVLATLHLAVLANVLQATSAPAKYQFAHPLLREVVYDSLTLAQRATTHGAVGVAIEKLGVVDAQLSAIAYHFHHAPLEQYFANAVRYARKAGDAALHARAYDEAARFYGWAAQAQEHAGPHGAAVLCELLLAGAGASYLALQPSSSRELCQRAIDLAVEIGSAETLLMAAWHLRSSAWIADLPDPLALRAVEHALQILPAEAQVMQARAYALLALLPPHSQRREVTQRLSREAESLAEGVGGDELLGALHSRLYGLSGPQHVDELVTVADAVLVHELPVLNRWAADALYARFLAALQRGDGAATERELSAYRAFATRAGLRFQHWQCDRLQAQLLLHAGQLDEAERRFEQLFSDAKQMHLVLGKRWLRRQRALLSYERSGSSDPEGSTTRYVARWAEQAPPELRVQSVLVCIERAELEPAAREFKRLAEHGFDAVQADVFGMGLLALLAPAAVALEAQPAIQRLRELLAPYVSMVAVTSGGFSHGCFARYLAVLEQASGEHVRARQLFELAEAVNTRAGHELERQRSVLGLAKLLGASSKPSERTRALELVSRIRAEAQGMGAFNNTASAQALEQQLRQAPLPVGCRRWIDGHAASR